MIVEPMAADRVEGNLNPVGRAYYSFSTLLCVLILLPMSWLAYYSVVDRDGAFTLENFGRFLTDETFIDPLIPTVIIAVSSSVACWGVSSCRTMRRMSGVISVTPWQSPYRKGPS